MKKATIFLGLMALAWFAIPTDQTLAANYYYPNNYQYQYSYQPAYTPTTYSYGNTMSQAQLSDFLRLLIVQLQSQVSTRPSYDYYGNSYGYKYNYVVSDPRGRGDDDDDDDNDYNDEEPDVETRSADDVSDNNARLRGSIDMNDFDDGEAFFVYGTDRNQVEDVEDDYDSYGDVDTDGERLRKVMVDSSADGSRSYETRVSGLNDDTRYYFAMCVGYEDEDNDDTIICDSTLNFTTDN